MLSRICQGQKTLGESLTFSFCTNLTLSPSFFFLTLSSLLPSYIIPVPVIKRFISGVEESGKYSGFCTLGVSCQATENIQLRECFGMRPEMTGVLVSRINPLSDAHKILKKDDILLEFDGVPIANDGTGEIKSCHICNSSICITNQFLLHICFFFHLPFYLLWFLRVSSTQ